MLTKAEYCETIVREAEEEYHIPSRSSVHHYIFRSGKLAVACEYLDLLATEEEKAFTAKKVGLISSISIFDKEKNYVRTKMLTVREMIKLLPEKTEDED